MKAGTWRVDPARSIVEVSIRHLGVATVKGTFADLEAQLEVSEDGSLGVRASIGTASLATGDGSRDEFLASPGFFNAAKHPRATFVAEGVSAADDRWTIPGTLTIAGTSAPLELEVETAGDAEEPVLSVRGELDRQAFGLRFPQAAGAGDAVVAKKVRLSAAVALSSP